MIVLKIHLIRNSSYSKCSLFPGHSLLIHVYLVTLFCIKLRSFLRQLNNSDPSVLMRHSRSSLLMSVKWGPPELTLSRQMSFTSQTVIALKTERDIYRWKMAFGFFLYVLHLHEQIYWDQVLEKHTTKEYFIVLYESKSVAFLQNSVLCCWCTKGWVRTATGTANAPTKLWIQTRHASKEMWIEH